MIEDIKPIRPLSIIKLSKNCEVILYSKELRTDVWSF